MATTPAPTSYTYENHIGDIQEWLADTAAISTTDPTKRDWCTLYLEDLTITEMYSYFDNSTLNTTFQTEYDKVNGTGAGDGNFTNKPIMYNQADSDAIDGLSKMFIYRHQPRLKNYRDDLENKTSRTYSSLSLSLARYALLKNLGS